ncbi:hypothetical protein DVH24_023918 [Malus domestica]|uniref:S-acyltransferase n=1 Tax=Malus domestica TaxID=3750 RepID=A0A498JJX8_MALDO|nr:hypothetical protein DVH24_023918 [Malus domestica]
MKFERFLSIPIFMVILLIGTVCYITVFIFIDGWVGLKSSAGSLNALVFISLASLCLFSFFCCVLTDPGHVPASYVPDVEHSVVSDQESKKNVSILGRLFVVMLTPLALIEFRPKENMRLGLLSRLHCLLTEIVQTFVVTSVLHTSLPELIIAGSAEGDHHCMWINNCVDYWNYKAFFMLALYATLACLYSTVMIIKCVSQKDFEFIGSDSHKVMSGLVMASLTVMLGALLGWHIYLITNNMTTIEEYEQHGWLGNLGKVTDIHTILVLGPSMLKWLCPTSVGHLKDGLMFPTPRDSS